MRSTQDIGAVNEASFHHRPNDTMVGTRFARLNVGAEKHIANEGYEDGNGGQGRFGLLGEHLGVSDGERVARFQILMGM